MKNIQTKQFTKFNFIKKSIGIILSVFLIFTFFAVTAEAGSYGQLVKGNKVSHEFKTGNFSTPYSYYYIGWKGEPDAIIGIKEGYVLESKLWKPFDPENISVRTLVQRMFRRDSSNFYGAWIKNDREETLGIWYSDRDGAKIKMAGDNQIAYISPKADTPFRFRTRFYN